MRFKIFKQDAPYARSLMRLISKPMLIAQTILSQTHTKRLKEKAAATLHQHETSTDAAAESPQTLAQLKSTIQSACQTPNSCRFIMTNEALNLREIKIIVKATKLQWPTRQKSSTWTTAPNHPNFSAKEKIDRNRVPNHTQILGSPQASCHLSRERACDKTSLLIMLENKIWMCRKF